MADAFALAATLLAYHRSTEDMTPNLTWQARLEQASDRFRKVKQKATETVSDHQPNGQQDVAVDAFPEPIPFKPNSAALDTELAPAENGTTGDGTTSRKW